MTDQDKINNGPSLLGEALLIGIRQVIREELQAVLDTSSLASPHTRSRRVKQTHFSVKEAARMVSLAPSTIRLYIRKGRLKAHKAGRRVLIAKADLESFLRMNPTGALPN